MAWEEKGWAGEEEQSKEKGTQTQTHARKRSAEITKRQPGSAVSAAKRAAAATAKQPASGGQRPHPTAHAQRVLQFKYNWCLISVIQFRTK
jgi:hypothetical protein